MFAKVKELLRYKNMMYSYTNSEVRARYKGSVLGVLWALLNPIFMLLVYGFVFSTVLKINIPNYYLFVMSGLLPWFFFKSSVMTSSNSIVGNSGLVKKVYFPREILPLAAVFSQFINYLIGLGILIIILLVSGIGINVNFIVLPLIILIQIVLTIGLAFLFSSLTVYLRDIRQILDVCLMVLFYLTPVVYRGNMVPERYKFIMQLNPLTTLVESYHNVLFLKVPPNYFHLIILMIVSCFLLVIGWKVFDRLNKGFAERI